MQSSLGPHALSPRSERKESIVWFLEGSGAVPTAFLSASDCWCQGQLGILHRISMLEGVSVTHPLKMVIIAVGSSWAPG